MAPEVSAALPQNAVTNGFGGTLAQIFQPAVLHDLAMPHKHDALGEPRRLGNIVRHHDHGFAELLEDVLELILQLVPNDRIECTQRFIQQQSIRIEHQPAHQGHTLALTTGQLGRIALQCARRQMSQRSQFFGTLTDALPTPSQMAWQQRQISQRRQMRK